MFRRLAPSTALLSAGFHVNDKKKESGENAGNVKTNVQPASGSVGDPASAKLNQSEKLTEKGVIDEGNITGWDRVKNLFRKSNYEELNPNMSFVINMAENGGIFGFLLGGSREYAKAFHLFITTNDATKFMNEAEAKSKLARVGFQAFLKGGILTGPKVGCLVGIFLLVETIVSEYRGKDGILEFPIAGSVTGAAIKWNLGIKGMISGCVSGGLAGLLLGPVLYCLLKLNGLTVSDTKNLFYSLEKKSEEILRAKEKRDTKTTSDVERFYDIKTKHLPPGFHDGM